MQGNIDIRFGNQLTQNMDSGILGRQRCHHQQGSQELAGYAAVNADVAAAETATQTHRWIIGLFKVIDLRSALA
ncbi:hypothetical protein D3C71_1981830 [compost metagenome]